jgi:hypothetical protein
MATRTCSILRWNAPVRQNRGSDEDPRRAVRLGRHPVLTAGCGECHRVGGQRARHPRRCRTRARPMGRALGSRKDAGGAR